MCTLSAVCVVFAGVIQRVYFECHFVLCLQESSSVCTLSAVSVVFAGVIQRVYFECHFVLCLQESSSACTLSVTLCCLCRSHPACVL